MTLLLALLLAQLPAQRPFPTSFTARQGTSRDGGTAWAVECTNCSGGGGTGNGLTYIVDAGAPLNVNPVSLSGPITLSDAGVLNVNPVSLSGPVTLSDAGVLNVNPVSLSGPVTLSDAGVLNVNPIAVASMPVLFIADAGVLNVNFPATQPVTGTFWQATQPVSATAMPLPTGAATDATLSQLLDGGFGQLAAIAASLTNGTQQTQVTIIQRPLNPFLPRCNPVRRTGCQP